MNRKLTIVLTFDFDLEPREGTDPANDSYIQGMVASQLHKGSLKEIQTGFRNALEDGLAEMEWDCEAKETKMTINVVDDQQVKKPVRIFKRQKGRLIT